MDTEHWAKEADRLLNDDTLNRALEEIRQECMEALSVANVDDKTYLLRLQAYLAIVAAIRQKLVAMVHARAEVPAETSPFV